MAAKTNTAAPAAKTPEQTAPDTRTPEQIIADLQAQLQEKDTIITGQALELKAAEAQGTEGRPVVTHEDQLYRVVAKQFDFEGTTIKAEELKSKPELVKQLVDKKSGVLKLVTKEEATQQEAQA